MNSNNVSKGRNTFLYSCLLLLCTATTTALASDDTVQIKQTIYEDAAGNTELLTLYGGDGNDFSKRIICGKDGGCTLFGYTNGSFGHTTDFLVIHLGPKTQPSWAETYGGSNTDEIFNAIPTSDGGYFTGGVSESMFFTGLKIFSPHHHPRPWYVKLDSSGKMQWAGNIEISTDISGSEIARTFQTPDGGYLLVGSYWEAYPDDGRQPMPDEWSGPSPKKTEGYQYYYPMVVKLSADGKPEWMQRYLFGDTGGWATSAVIMPSVNILIAGTVSDKKTGPLYLMETDPAGEPLHAETYTLTGAQGSNAFIQLSDGSYMLTGHLIEGNAPHSVVVVHFAADGKFDSGSLFKFPAGIRSLGLAQGQDGRICIVGRTEDGSANKAEGMALLVDEHSNDLGEFWLSGSGNTELEDVAPIAAGGFDILGDTRAFGATYFDMVRFTWLPGEKMTKRLVQEPYQPTVASITVTFQTGKIDLIRNVPLGFINFQSLSMPSGEDKH
ncbi:MAG: hypothetical protein WBR29_05165 [Gammaproteobacteria bacterium]